MTLPITVILAVPWLLFQREYIVAKLFDFGIPELPTLPKLPSPSALFGSGGKGLAVNSISSTIGSKLGVPNRQFAQGDLNARSEKELNYKAFVIAQEYKGSTGKGILVEAWLPETVGMDVNANYDAPFAQGIANQVPENVGALARFLGMSLTTQAFTIQVWQGGAFIEFQIPFIFQAESSPANDVMRPIKDLLKLTMPKDPNGGGLLEAPGPVIDLKRLSESGASAASAIAEVAGGISVSSVKDTFSELKSDTFGVLSSLKNSAERNIARPLSNAIVNSIKNNISLYIGKFLYLPSVVITDVSPTYDVMIGPDRNPIRATVNVNFRTFFIPTQNDIDVMFPSATESTTQKGI